MSNRRRMARLVRQKLRSAGKQVERARREYLEGVAAADDSAPEKHRIVCRRHAERRRVSLDERQRPGCFDPTNTDCRGCVEDIRTGQVETWDA